MIKRLFKWLLILFLIVLLLLLIAVGVAYYFAGTDQGFQYTTKEVVSRIEGLEVEGSSGNLTEGISAESLSYTDSAIVIKAQNVDTQWRSGCLLDREFCLDKVFIEELYLEPQATTEAKATEPAERITLPTVKLPLALNAEEIFIKTLRLRLPNTDTDQVLTDIKLQAKTRDSKVQLQTLTASYNNVTATVHGDFELKGNYPMDATVDVVATDVFEDYDVALSTKLLGSLDELSLEAHISNAAELTVTGTLKPLEKQLPANLHVQSDQIGWPLDTLEMAKAEEFSLKIEGDMDDYAVSLESKVSGASIPESTLKLDGFVNTQRLLLPNTTVLTLGGFATGSTALSWSEQITWFAELIAKDIDPSIHLANINGNLNALLKANGAIADGQWSLDVERAKVEGDLSGYPLQLQTRISKTLDDVWNVPLFELQNGNNTVVANGILTDQWDVDALIQLPELQNFLPGLAGGFSIDAKIGGDKLKPDVSLSADSNVFKFDNVLVQGAKLTADIKSDATLQSQVDLALTSINLNGSVLRNTTLALAGTQQEHTLDFFTDGPSQTALKFSAAGGLSETFDWIGQLRQAEIELPAHDLLLDRPTAISWNNEDKSASVAKHCWTSLQARLCLDNDVVAAADGLAELSIANYPMNRIDPFLPANSSVKGILSANSTVRWGENHPGGFVASLTSGVKNGGFTVSDDTFDDVDFDYESLNLDVTADGNRVSSKLLVNSTNLGNAEIVVDLLPKEAEMPIDGNVNLQGFDIGFVQAFLPGFEMIAGKVNATGSLSGSLSDPKFNGEVSLNDPVVQSTDLPLGIDGGRVTAKINGKRAFIQGALDSGDGDITLTGNANWARSPWRVRMDVSGEQLAIVQAPIESSEVFPKLVIRAQPGAIKVNGTVEIPKAVINVRDLPQGAATLSSDIVVIEDQYEADAFKSVETSGPGTDLEVAVTVTLGDEVELSAYGLDANLTGDIKVSIESPNPPQLTGEITVVEGIYQQYGQDLKVTDGQILFVGPIDQTRLNMDAVREIETEERIAGLSLQGQIAEPEVTLFTEPADKPQESILSYIVLGRDLSEASDQESNLLASAALALTLKGSRGVAGNVAERIGIEDFALDARGQGDDTEVVVSGRLNERLLLRYGRSVFQPESTLYLRYDITRQLYLEAAQGVEQAVDLFYSFSF
ncbi:MAG: translocation/assembly module TamB [Gammaproteobacteria bacterium]|nr:translocation/assembly module TamB [Gammaproteobacteria bacterium]